MALLMTSSFIIYLMILLEGDFCCRCVLHVFQLITNFINVYFSQVTTHSHLLSSDEVDDLKNLLEEMGSSLDIHSFLLQEFDTELDFTSKVGLVDSSFL